MSRHNLGLAAGDDAEAEATEEYLCAKMHLVDLAGSERLGRTMVSKPAECKCTLAK